MNWFEQLCRNVGLMVHNAQHPETPKGLPNPPQSSDLTHTQLVNKTVQERKLDENITLRRTTIDEVEIKRGS